MNDSIWITRSIRMLRCTVVLAFACKLCLVLPAAGAEQAVPRGAFLKYPIHSVADLLLQLRKEPLVSTRYARLFHMSPTLVRAAFAEMHLTKTNSDSIRKIYYVHPGEQIGYRVRRLKQATMVFVNPEGTPVLVAACGNPIRPSADAAQFAVPPVPDFSILEEQSANAPGAQEFSFLLRNESPDDFLARDAVGPAASDFVAADDAVPVKQPIPAFHEDLSPAQLRKVSSDQLLEWIGGAGLLGPLLLNGRPMNFNAPNMLPVPIFNNNNNSPSLPPNIYGGSNGSDIGDSNKNDQEMAVPESSTQLFLVFGIAGFIVFLSLKKRLKANSRP